MDVMNAQAPAEAKKPVRRQTPSEAAISGLRRAATELEAAYGRLESPSEETRDLFKDVETVMDALHAHLHQNVMRERRARARNGA